MGGDGRSAVRPAGGRRTSSPGRRWPCRSSASRSSSPRSSSSIFGVATPSPLPPTGELSGLLLQLLVGAIIAPIAEEILFRGFAVTAWRRSIGASRAIVRATLLFALAHVVGVAPTDDFGQALGLIAVGAGTRLPVAWVLGWVFVRRGSIWAPIGLHATFNAVLLILAHVAQVAAPIRRRLSRRLAMKRRVSRR